MVQRFFLRAMDFFGHHVYTTEKFSFFFPHSATICCEIEPCSHPPTAIPVL